MLKIENVVLPSDEQWKAIIRGMRNPKNSWERSDSICNDNICYNQECDKCENCQYFYGWDTQCIPALGENDLTLMKTLVKGGPVHAKFRRMIPVFFDITAPLYWWKEFDTYKISTVRNSCSTMHKIHSKEFEVKDFSIEHLRAPSLIVMSYIIQVLNFYRKRFLETKNKSDWWNLIQLLPSSYNQRSTIMLNYEVLYNMYHSRRHHKLDEWHTFCDWIETLPYAKELIIGEKGDDENGRE